MCILIHFPFLKLHFWKFSQIPSKINLKSCNQLAESPDMSFLEKVRCLPLMEITFTDDLHTYTNPTGMYAQSFVMSSVYGTNPMGYFYKKELSKSDPQIIMISNRDFSVTWYPAASALQALI